MASQSMDISSSAGQAQSINAVSSTQYNNTEGSPTMWALGWIMLIIGIFMVFIGVRMFLLKKEKGEKNDIID
jgi:succinate dehydrogenase/fumarate reductase cytochrome b subunit